MLLYLLVYLCIGVILTIAMSIIHMIKAIRKGYDIDTINQAINRALLNQISKGRVICGLLIWPIRLIEFIDYQKYLFNLYNQYIKESK